MTNKTEKYIIRSVGIVVIGLISYWILWMIFKDKMPFSEIANHIYENYDYYAEKVIYSLPIIVITIIFLFSLRPTSKKRFLRLQSVLATSKINAVAMGLVEIQGKLIMQNHITSPVENEVCIGYFYKIEKISEDKDGKNSYTTIHQETKCKDFIMKDDSGEIEIIADGIEFFMLDFTSINMSHNMRYSEIVVKENQEMLLVGNANSENGKALIHRNNEILGITSVINISLWNKYQPLLKSFLLTCFVILVLILIVLSQ